MGGTVFFLEAFHLPLRQGHGHQPLARASPASRTSILRNSNPLVTRSGKSSRSVVLPACMSMPSGSQPVQDQSADFSVQQPRGVEVHRLAVILVHVRDGALLGLEKPAGIPDLGQKLCGLEVDDAAKAGDQMQA